MFGPEYMTVGAYLTDGGIVCRECGERRRLPVRDSVSVAQVEAEFHEGLTCDDCMMWIVEPTDLDNEDDTDEEVR